MDFGSKSAVLEFACRPMFLALTVYSKSLELGILPSDWKLGEVTAIYKKGSDRGSDGHS